MADGADCGLGSRQAAGSVLCVARGTSILTFSSLLGQDPPRTTPCVARSSVVWPDNCLFALHALLRVNRRVRRRHARALPVGAYAHARIFGVEMIARRRQ